MTLEDMNEIIDSLTLDQDIILHMFRDGSKTCIIQAWIDDGLEYMGSGNSWTAAPLS